jgi:uracil-DNA glycosylase
MGEENHQAQNQAGGHGSAADLVPSRPTIASLERSAAECRGCRLYRSATQTVFGEGSAKAEIMLIGEQPGDREDLAGKPFVGPAGNLLDRALEEAGIDRKKVYVTNAVKHFKWTPRGKRRIHKKPAADEIAACRPWLEAEIQVVKPQVIVCLGATAAQAMLGRQFRVTQQRGQFMRSPLAPWITATVHPSSILRAETDEDRRREMEAFVKDLQRVAQRVRKDDARAR